MRSLPLALLALLFVSASARAQWNPATGQWGKVDPADLRVMTYNIEDAICSSNAKVEGQNDWCAIARLVAAFKPDILILEECGDNSGQGTGSGVDSVATLTNVINLFLHGGTDTYNGNTPITSWVQKYAPGFDMPYIFVSSSTDGFNRNAMLSRFPFTDLNGDGNSTMSNIPNVTATGYSTGGDGGIRGFMFCEFDLPNATYLGNLVVGGAHLKAGSLTSDQAARVKAAQNVAYVVRHWWNGDGGSVPDPFNKIADSPVATNVLDANTPVVLGGDWNEDEVANGAFRGPADWLTQALVVGGTNDGTDRDGTDMTLDPALNFFTGSDASHSSGKKYDYIGFQDSIATMRLATIFISGSTPSAAQPPEVIGFTGGTSSVTSTASDHRPVFVDLRLPIVDCNMNGIADTTDIALGSSLDTNLNQIPDECECFMSNYCVLSPNSVGAGAVISGSGSLSIAQNSFSLGASGLPFSTLGLFFYSQTQAQIPFGNGTRCIGGAIVRLPIVGASPFGLVSFPLNFNSLVAPGIIGPGQDWHFQYWFRDAQGGGSNFNLTDGLRVRFCP
ncbi:MAG: hypothetical protein JNL28_03275 [Planctomycetes bacterium]|nr:hypothetical protein [Planctomycetota bacterium]